jgi:hypothetical protein
MAPTLNPSRARIFRITHVANVPWIIEHGLHASNGKVKDSNFRNIGIPELIGKRSKRNVAVGPGGTLADYIPFYFTPYSIMLYNIRTGYNVPSVPNDEIVIFVSSLHKLVEHSIPFVFTDQHAYPMMANYYTRLEDLPEIDWDLLNRRDFKHNPDDPGKKERYQAEALVWKHLPIEALLGICCHSTTVSEHIESELKKRKKSLNVIVQKSWYF